MGHLVDTCTNGHEFQIIYSGRKGDLNFILKCMSLYSMQFGSCRVFRSIGQMFYF